MASMLKNLRDTGLRGSWNLELHGVSIEVRAAVGNAGIILLRSSKLAILSKTCWCKHAAFAMPSHGGCHGTSLSG